MAIALVSSLILVVLGETGIVEVHRYAHFVPSIDFSNLVFHGFLAFLLFAGALHVDLGDLYKVKWTVTILSTLGTIISTFVIGALFWCAAYLLGYELRFIFALLFGALISPTDPIAVLGIIKKAGAPKDLETRITGESLFNDSVGTVIFLSILDIATGQSEPSVASVSWFFVQETLGGILLGWLLGWIGVSPGSQDRRLSGRGSAFHRTMHGLICACRRDSYVRADRRGRRWVVPRQ